MANIVKLEDLEQKARLILLGLPKSFYLKTRSINVDLSTTAPTSFFKPDTFEIVVSLNNIKLAIENAQRLLTDDELEFVLRSQLYHEISHAILTPKELMLKAHFYSTNNQLLNPYFANVIEDERIETLLKNYYYGVDFKKQLRWLIKFVPQPQNFEHFVFNAVRFRFSPHRKDEVKHSVLQFIQLANPNRIDHDADCICYYMEQLLKQLKVIYDDFVQQQSKNQNGQSNQQGNENENDAGQGSSSSSEGKTCSGGTSSSCSQDTEDESEEGENSSNSNSAKHSDSLKNEDGDETQESSVANAAEDEETDGDESSSIEEELDEEDLNDNTGALEKAQFEETMKRAITGAAMNAGGDKYVSNKIHSSRTSDKAKLYVAIAKNNGFGSRPKAPSSYGTCGRFSSRGYIKDITNENPSFKWFNRKVNASHEKNGKTNVKTLNIWLDNSGSYCGNDDETNKVLKALCEIEKERTDFKFRLITFGDRFLEKFDEFRTSCSNQGTSLKGFSKEYQERNKTGKEFNIFLIDGSGDCMEQLRCLNNNKSVLIVDRGVANTAKYYAPNAKAIISVSDGTYPQVLAENVVKAVESLF